MNEKITIVGIDFRGRILEYGRLSMVERSRDVPWCGVRAIRPVSG